MKILLMSSAFLISSSCFATKLKDQRRILVEETLQNLGMSQMTSIFSHPLFIDKLANIENSDEAASYIAASAFSNESPIARYDLSLPGKLFLGAEANAIDQNDLEQHNIDVVINVVASQVPSYFKDRFTYVEYPILDLENEDLPLEHAVFQIEDFLKQGKNVFVHCIEGKSRSGSLIIASFMKLLNVDYDTALANVREKRSFVKPNHGFEIQLRQFGS